MQKETGKWNNTFLRNLIEIPLIQLTFFKGLVNGKILRSN